MSTLSLENQQTTKEETNQELAQLYADSIHDFEEGSLVQGTVVRITPRDIFVDIGYKAEGVIALSEFDDPKSLQLGQTVEVFLESKDTEDGLLLLSKRKADRDVGWGHIINKYKEEDIIKGTVIKKVKGGLTVDIGSVEAFLPASLVALKGFTNLDQFVGQVMDVKIIKINRSRKNIVVSRRDALVKEMEEKKTKLLSELQVGIIREGAVKNITDFGVFVDLGGIDGLLHITDMSWGRINHPSEIVSIGDKIEVKILDYDKENNRISLGLKQKIANPWTQALEKYPVGTKIQGKVVNIVPYGAFIELEKGIEGLVHISELSWTRRVGNPNEIVKIGESVEAVVLSVEPENQKMALGIRQAVENPWTKIEQRYPPGTRIKGKVRNVTDYGAFIEIEEGIDGLVHISDMSWTRRLSHPSEVLKKGQKIEAVVLSTDVANQKVSLGIKQLMLDPWGDLVSRYPVGTLVEGKVTKLASFGVFVEIEPEIEGLVHVSEIEEGGSLEQRFKIGAQAQVRVIRMDEEKRQIGLSMKQVSI